MLPGTSEMMAALSVDSAGSSHRERVGLGPYVRRASPCWGSGPSAGYTDHVGGGPGGDHAPLF